MTTIDRQPYDLDAERAVLGSVLLNRDAIVPIAGWLTPDAFFLARHQQVYSAMLACYRRRVPPDLRTVSDALRQSGDLDAVGGVLFLTELVDGVPTSYHVEAYARIVDRHAGKRNLIAAGGKIAALGYDDALERDAAMAQAQALLVAAQPDAQRGGFVSLRDALDAMDSAPPRADLLYTGLTDLDRLTGGIGAGNLCLLAGIPGSGKTSLATQTAWEYAKAIGPAAVLSLEMTREELIQRLIAYDTGVPVQAQRADDMTDEQRTMTMRWRGEFFDAPLFIEDTSGLGVDDIRLRALRKAHDCGGLGMLVVDYLGLVAMSFGRNQNYIQALNSTAQAFKNLAKELHCPLILCSQLNRDIFRRPDKRPTMADLREAGEAPADQIIVVMRPSQFDEAERPGEADLYLVKNRHNQTGVAGAFYDGPRFRFRNLVRYRDMEGY